MSWADVSNCSVSLNVTFMFEVYLDVSGLRQIFILPPYLMHIF
jgi:hypothetical protein